MDTQASTCCPRPLPLLALVLGGCCALLLVLPSPVQAGKRRCTIDDYRAGAPKMGFICGQQIPRTLSLVCGSYNGPSKRDLRTQYGDWHGKDAAAPWGEGEGGVEEEDGARWDSDVFLPRASALSYLRHRRSAGDHYRTGVYCECCVHRCGYYELTSYCGDGGRDKRDVSAVAKDTHAQPSWLHYILQPASGEASAASADDIS